MLFEAQRKAAVWLLLAALLLTAHPATARAASVIQAGGLTLAGEGLIDGVDYSYGSNTLTIKSDKPVTISGSTQHDVVVIDSPLQAYVTLDNLSIDVSAIPDKASFRVANALSASIKLKGASSLKSGANCAGLQKETTALNIVISSEDANAPGSLVASGGNGGAGIGGGSGMPATDIAVNGCTVTAYGGTGGAGIGGGRGETGAMLSLGSCTVIAEGGAEAAGIGGGSGGAGSQMDFYWNANITARGGAGGGAGIGGGMNGGSSRIDISNCNITAEGGSGGGAGIGGGGGTAPIMPGYAHVGAQITLSAGAGVYSMTFKGGAGGGAGIGGGNGGYGDIITISSGKLIAAGADGGAGIGGGSGGYGKNIIIAGGELAATGDAGGAGIGGGLGSDGAIITFANGTVVANGGGSANGGGAGVGGGAGGNASEVNISGGSLNATGGSGNGGGAGAKIGGGGTTSVNGADIDVYFKPLAIGSPVRAELYTFTLINPSKTPVTLKASSINDSLTYVAYDVKSDKDNKLYFHLPPFEGSAIVFSTEEDRLGYINTAIASDGRAFELQPVMLPGYEKPTIPSGGEASPTVYSDEVYSSTRTLNDPNTKVGVSGEIHGQATLGVEKDPALSGPCEQELAHAKEQSFASYDIWLNNDELLVRLPVPEAYNGRSIEVLHCTTEGVETLTALANDGMVQVSVSALGTFLLRLPGEKDAQPVTPVSQVPATGGAAYGALLLLPAVSLLAFVMQRKGFLNKKEE